MRMEAHQVDHFTLENLSISFGGLKAVNNVSFSVEKNEIFSIIGPNGSGKTTIFNMISGIYKPNAGRILCEGENLVGLTPDRIARRGIARTFQNIELFSNATVMDNLLLGRHIHMATGVFTGAFMWGRRSWAAREEIRNREIVEEIIDFLDLQSVRDQFVAALPYGKRKLVELGRALALEPKILLLDEPSAGMNTEEKQDLNIWIKDIQDRLSGDDPPDRARHEHDHGDFRPDLRHEPGGKDRRGDARGGPEPSRGDQGLSGGGALMLKVNNIETWYDLIRALHGISFEVKAGRHRGPSGFQRGREIDDAQDDHAAAL